MLPNCRLPEPFALRQVGSLAFTTAPTSVVSCRGRAVNGGRGSLLCRGSGPTSASGVAPRAASGSWRRAPARRAAVSRIVVRERKVPAGPAPHPGMKASRARPSDDEASAPTERDGHDHRCQPRIRCVGRQQRPGHRSRRKHGARSGSRWLFASESDRANRGVAFENDSRTRSSQDHSVAPSGFGDHSGCF